MGVNRAELHQQEYCDSLLRRSLNNRGIYDFLYGGYHPSIDDRFTMSRSIDYFGMVEALYRKNANNPELNIPKLVNDAMRQSYDLKLKQERYGRYISNLIHTFNIIYAHLIETEQGKANFELDPSIYADSKQLIGDNIVALKDRKMYDELLKKDDYIVQRGHDSRLK